MKKLVAVAPLLSAIAALCSAVAAIFSAIAASTNASNASLVIRPALYPSGWTLVQIGEDLAEIRFKHLENRGQGPAMLVLASLEADYPNEREKSPGVIFGGLNPRRIERINAGERADGNFFGTFPWPLVADGCKSASLRVSIRSTDLHGNRWQTTYALRALKTPRLNCGVGMGEVAPNLNYIGIVDDGPFRAAPPFWLWASGALGAVILALSGAWYLRRHRRVAEELNDG